MVISIFYFSTGHRIWVLYCVAEMLFRRAGQRLWGTTHGLFFPAGEQDRSFLPDSLSCQFMFFLFLLLLFIHLFLYISSHLYTPNQYIRTVKWCAKLSGRRGTAWISPSATFSLKLGLKKNKVCNANLLSSGMLFVRVIWKSRWIFLPLYLIFNRRIIALQNFVVFCQTSTRISHRCTHVTLLPRLSRVSLIDSQRARLCSLSHIAISHRLSILHRVL